MKRIVIVSVLLIFCIWVSAYTEHHVHDVADRVLSGVDGALDALAKADEEKLRRHVDDLSNFWDKEEDRLIHFVRHSQIDEITKSVARLEALTVGEDYSELTAELMSIRWQMEHLNRSESMRWSNLL